MPTKPLAADFRVLTSHSGAGVIEATSRIAHDHAHSATDVVGRDKTRTKASTGGRIEETGKIGGEFKVQTNPEFLQKRKELFDSILASEKERLAGTLLPLCVACGNSFSFVLSCSKASRTHHHYNARWCHEGGCVLGNHPYGHCSWHFQEPSQEGRCCEGSCQRVKVFQHHVQLTQYIFQHISKLC